MVILHPKTMYQCDRKTMDELGIKSLSLMEKAGKAIYQEMLKTPLFNHANKRLIISGTGNNGGDGLVIAEHLINDGKDCTVVMMGKQNAVSAETKTVLNRLNISVNWNQLPADLDAYDVIIDALFGIGLDRHLDDQTLSMIQRVNASKLPVLSIDIPSGISAETGMAMPDAFKATKTYIVQYYKFGNLLNQANDYHGQRILVDVGIVLSDIRPEAVLMNPSDYYQTMPARLSYSHKYHYGNLLIYACRVPMLGAPMLSAEAALRCGTGLVRLLLDERDKQLIKPYDIVLQTVSANDQSIEGLERIDSIVFGPGVGRDSHHQKVFDTLLNSDVPMVIDADGLYHLSKSIDGVKKDKVLILTPHQGEFERFFNLDKASMYQDLFNHLKRYDSHSMVWVLKGPTTMIYYQGECIFSNLAHPALATAGTGDVLSGIIASFLARGYHPYKAAQYGVLVHSLAAQEALQTINEESMIASDLILSIPKIIDLLKENS